MPTKLVKEIGRNIAAYRKTAGLTQETLAEKTGVTVETISRIERGATTPSVSRLDQCAHALGIRLTDLLDFKRGRTNKDKALKEVSRELSRRSAKEIDLVRDLARRIFKHIG